MRKIFGGVICLKAESAYKQHASKCAMEQLELSELGEQSAPFRLSFARRTELVSVVFVDVIVAVLVALVAADVAPLPTTSAAFALAGSNDTRTCGLFWFD